MTRCRGNAKVAAPDLREHWPGVAGVADSPPLTCTATGNICGHRSEGPMRLWGSRTAATTSTVTSSAKTSTARARGAGSTKRVTRTGSRTGTRPGTAPGMALGSLTVLPLALAHTGHLELHVSLKLVLALIGLGVFWVLTLLVKPFGACWACGGKGVRVHGRRARRCWLCKGKGRRQRTGSRTVHRIRRHAVAGWRARRDGAR